MNVLPIIRRSMQKEQRLRQAQYLMAKAYRGVPYNDAPIDQPHSGPRSFTYRGTPYKA